MSRRVPGVRRVSLENGRGDEGRLAAFNAQSDDRQLHPTKGWRKLNVKRGRAHILLDLIHMGAALPTALQAKFLRDGYMPKFGGN